MPTHAMIDLETLDTNPTAAILSIGAVKFDPYNPGSTPHDKTLWKPDIEEQLAKGRTTSDSTLEWWSKQDEHIRDMTFTSEGRVPVGNIFTELNRYLVGVDKIWCQGPQFDMVMLEDIYRQYEHHNNWAFWQIMDSRTLFNLMPKDPRKDIQENLHSADDDAYWQAVCVQRSFAHFGVTRR